MSRASDILLKKKQIIIETVEVLKASSQLMRLLMACELRFRVAVDMTTVTLKPLQAVGLFAHPVSESGTLSAPVWDEPCDYDNQLSQCQC